MSHEGRIELKRALVFVACIGLISCSGQSARESGEASSREPAMVWQTPETLMVAQTPAEPLLDVAVELLDPGVSPEDSTPGAAVRRLESQLLAGDLRQTLIRSNQWGVVRIVPEASALTPVSIRARILESNGRDLVLDVLVEDALGAIWFEQKMAYRQGLDEPGASGFEGVFNALSNRLLEAWQARSVEGQQVLIEATAITYAQELVPGMFSGMIQRSEQGWKLVRLPAGDDPMLERIDRVRHQEYLFCDTIDEQFTELAGRVRPTYALWREATLEQMEWLERYEQRAAARSVNAADSDFSRMQAEYAAYRSYRIQEQALFDLAEAFDGESQPTVMRTQDQIFKLEGTLETQYETWRRLLRDIYMIEQGS